MNQARTVKEEQEVRGRMGRMTIWAIRAFFLLISAGTGALLGQLAPVTGLTEWDWIIGMMVLFAVVMLLEIVLGRASDISALVFGLVVGVILSFLSHSLIMLAFPEAADSENNYSLAIRLILICVFCYLSVVLVYKTRHRYSFIIPYIEFHRLQKGPRALMLDTSAIIDGRIADICDTRVFDTPIIIPRFILRELQAIADSSDRLKRSRGRRGLDVVNRLQESKAIEIHIEEGEVPGSDSVDSKLVRLANSMAARIVTTDFNLNKVAQIQGVGVLNINELANALRPVFIPGEELNIQVVREGSEQGQGIGYLDDGTMVVIDGGIEHLGSSAAVEVTRTLQTAAGKMVFGRVKGSGNSTNGRTANGRQR